MRVCGVKREKDELNSECEEEESEGGKKNSSSWHEAEEAENARYAA